MGEEAGNDRTFFIPSRVREGQRRLVLIRRDLNLDFSTSGNCNLLPEVSLGWKRLVLICI